MKVSSISFKGYSELFIPVGKNRYYDERAICALKNARPYLRQIGESMPYPRDLVVEMMDNGLDTCIKVSDFNKKTKKAKVLTIGTEHNLTEHGLDLVQHVFEGLEKNSKKEFREIAGNFVKRFNKIMWEKYPIEPKFPFDYND